VHKSVQLIVVLELIIPFVECVQAWKNWHIAVNSDFM